MTQFRAFSSIAFCLYALQASAQLWEPVAKRNSLVRGRESAEHALTPKNSVTLSYSERETGQPRLYTTDLVLNSHDDSPFVLLEEIEHLAKSITCEGDEVELELLLSEYVDSIEKEWETPIVITNHYLAGCNDAGERTPKRVTDITIDKKSSTVKLLTEKTTWEASARSMSATLDHSSIADYHRDLVRRESGNSSAADTNSTTISLDTPIDPRLELWPISANGTDLNSLLPAKKQLPDVNITCVDCGMTGEVLISGAWDVDFSLTDGDGFAIETAYVAIQLSRALNATANLEISAPAGTTFQYALPLLPQHIGFPGLMLPIGGVTIGPQLNLKVVLDLEVDAGSVNVTYGVQALLPAGAISKLDFRNMSGTTYGWDKLNVTELPLVINALEGQNLTMGANITAHPSLAFGISVGGAVEIADAEAGFAFSVPTVYSSLEYLQNVTADCEPLNATQYEYFPDAVLFESGLEVSIDAYAQFTGDLIPAALDQSWSKNIWGKDLGPVVDGMPSRCMAFDSARPGEAKLASESTPTVDEEKKRGSTGPSICLNVTLGINL